MLLTVKDFLLTEILEYYKMLECSCGAVAQLGEHTAGSRKVRGSIPLSSTKKYNSFQYNIFGPLAQLVEQLTLNQEVPGSSP